MNLAHNALHCYFGFRVDRLSFLLNVSIVPEYRKWHDKNPFPIIKVYLILEFFCKSHIVLLFCFCDKILLNLKHVIFIVFEFGI